MSDILKEIDEELQREHMAALWRKYKIPVLGAIALVILATATFSTWRQHKESREVALSVALGSLATRPGMTEPQKVEAFQAFARQNPETGQGVLAQLTAVGGLLKDGKRDEAIKQLDALANDSYANQMTKDYARLIRIQLLLDTGDPVALRQQLVPLAENGQPWRYNARMMQGLLYGKHGDYVRARDIFKALGESSDAPTTTREEAKLLARYYATQG